MYRGRKQDDIRVVFNMIKHGFNTYEALERESGFSKKKLKEKLGRLLYLRLIEVDGEKISAIVTPVMEKVSKRKNNEETLQALRRFHQERREHEARVKEARRIRRIYV